MPFFTHMQHDDNDSAAHDKESLAYRLSHIVIRLFMGDKLSLSDLAQDFRVSERTIYRDLRERLAILDIECQDKRYFLSKRQCGARLTSKDLMRFAQMTSVNNLFPKLDSQFATILTAHHVSPFIIHTHTCKTQIESFGAFLLITESILTRQSLSFDVDSHKYPLPNEVYVLAPQTSKVNHVIDANTPFKPYRLVHVNQTWFLVGCYLSHLAVYRYDTLMNVKKQVGHFKPNEQLLSIMSTESFIQALPHYELLTVLSKLTIKDGTI